MTGCASARTRATSSGSSSKSSVRLTGGHLGAGDHGDMPVQRVGGLEEGRRPTRAAVGEQEALQDLVGPVGAEQLIGSDPVRPGHRGPQLGRLAIGVPVELDATQFVPERLEPRVGRREGRLVGVEPHLHVDLGRVIAVQADQVRPDGYCCWPAGAGFVAPSRSAIGAPDPSRSALGAPDPSRSALGGPVALRSAIGDAPTRHGRAGPRSRPG